MGLLNKYNFNGCGALRNNVGKNIEASAFHALRRPGAPNLSAFKSFAPELSALGFFGALLLKGFRMLHREKEREIERERERERVTQRESLSTKAVPRSKRRTSSPAGGLNAAGLRALSGSTLRFLSHSMYRRSSIPFRRCAAPSATPRNLAAEAHKPPPHLLGPSS